MVRFHPWALKMVFDVLLEQLRLVYPTAQIFFDVYCANTGCFQEVMINVDGCTVLTYERQQLCNILADPNYASTLTKIIEAVEESIRNREEMQRELDEAFLDELKLLADRSEK